MCKKCAMVADGDGWQWPGFLTSSHLDPRSGDFCHQPIPPLPSVSRWKSVPWNCSARWMALCPAGSSHLPPPRDCEQLRLEYPERMPTIRPSKVIRLPWEWWRFAWCYQLWRKSGRLSRVRTSRGQECPPLISSSLSLPDCPCFPQTIKTTREFP